MNGQLAVLATMLDRGTYLCDGRFDDRAEAVAAAQRLRRQHFRPDEAPMFRDFRVVRVVEEAGRYWEPVDWEAGA